MSETRIAVAFVALGVALLVGTFAYLAYDRGEGTRTTAAADSAEQEEPRRSGAQTGVDGPEPAKADPREAVPTEGDQPAPPADVPPAAGEQAAPSQPYAPVPPEGNASVPQGTVPAYTPLRESEADGVTEVVVDTGATGEDEMRLVASDLASDYLGEGVLLVGFRQGANGDASAGRETGFALVFGSREAAMAPDLEYTPEEVDEIFREDGGVRAVSYEDFGRENPALRDDLARISAS